MLLHVHQKCDHVSDSFLFPVSFNLRNHSSLLQRSRKAAGDLRTLGHGPNVHWWAEVKKRVEQQCLPLQNMGLSTVSFLFSPCCLVSFMHDFEIASRFQRDFELRDINHYVETLLSFVSIALSSPLYNSAANTKRSERCHDNCVRCVGQRSFEPVSQPSCCQY